VISISLLWLSINACSDGYFTSEIEIDLPEQDTVLNAFGVIQLSRNSVTVRLSHTRSFEDDGEFRIIDDAHIEMTIDDNQTVAFEHTVDGQYVMIDNVNLIVADKFDMRIDHPRYPNTSTIVFRPQSVFLDQVTIDTSRLSRDNDYLTTITFEDPPGDNYYILQATIVTPVDRGSVFLSSDLDGFFVQTEFGLVFDDLTFDNDEVSLIVNTQRELVGIEGVTINYLLSSINESLYDYLVQVDYAQENEENPFAEPFSVPSSFDNALGVLGILSTSNKVADVR